MLSVAKEATDSSQTRNRNHCHIKNQTQHVAQNHCRNQVEEKFDNKNSNPNSNPCSAWVSDLDPSLESTSKRTTSLHGCTSLPGKKKKPLVIFYILCNKGLERNISCYGEEWYRLGSTLFCMPRTLFVLKRVRRPTTISLIRSIWLKIHEGDSWCTYPLLTH